MTELSRLPDLRPIPQVEYVNPLSFLQDLPGIRALAIGARFRPDQPQGYQDGYTVFSGTPRNGYTYVELNKLALESLEQGRPPLDVYNEYFDASHTEVVVPKAKKGQPIHQYLQLMDTVLTRTMVSDQAPHRGLPHPFAVPGARFRHPFPHDNFCDASGKMVVGNFIAAQNTIDNDVWQTMKYGYPWNATADPFAGRSQDPFLSYTIERFAHAYGEHAKEVIRHYRPALERYYKFWTAGEERLANVPLGEHAAHRRVVRMPGGERMFRNYDDSPIDYTTNLGGRWESLLEDRETVDRALHRIRDKDERARRWEYVLRGIAAACEGCFDFSATRQFRDYDDIATIMTLDLVPVNLNANMVHLARMISVGYEAEGNMEAADAWRLEADTLSAAIRKYNYLEVDEDHAEFRDCLLDGTKTNAISIAMTYPLAAGGIVNYKEAVKIGRSVRKHKLLAEYGFRTSTVNTPQQWDGDMVWATPNVIAPDGFMLAAQQAKRAGDLEAARFLMELPEEGTGGYVSGVDSFFNEYGVMPERTHGYFPLTILLKGEYAKKDKKTHKKRMPVGFGMTNGAFRINSSRDFQLEYDNPEVSWRRITMAHLAGRSAVANMIR